MPDRLRLVEHEHAAHHALAVEDRLFEMRLRPGRQRVAARGGKKTEEIGRAIARPRARAGARPVSGIAIFAGSPIGAACGIVFSTASRFGPNDLSCGALTVREEEHG